jgi:hypothetical protein
VLQKSLHFFVGTLVVFTAELLFDLAAAKLGRAVAFVEPVERVLEATVGILGFGVAGAETGVTFGGAFLA